MRIGTGQLSAYCYSNLMAVPNFEIVLDFDCYSSHLKRTTMTLTEEEEEEEGEEEEEEEEEEGLKPLNIISKSWSMSGMFGIGLREDINSRINGHICGIIPIPGMKRAI